jgi:hypothetical protein
MRAVTLAPHRGIAKMTVALAVAALLVPAITARAAETADAHWVPVKVRQVVLIDKAPAVLLLDEPRKQFLLVFVDLFMATAIQLGMEPSALERPLTHDLIGIVLQRVGARLSKVVITELKDNTYYALIFLQVNGREERIDARPSDALALAVRSHVPIEVADSLLQSVEKAPPGDSPPGEAPAGPTNPQAGEGSRVKI